MTNLIVAYALIGVVLVSYGATLYRRLHAVERGIRAREERT